MGSKATKAVGNAWYQARLEASTWDEALRSRAGASEQLGMSESAVADAELGVTKIMPPEKAMVMSDVYKAPQLINYFCTKQCPIGEKYVEEIKDVDVEQATVHLLHSMNSFDKGKILDVANNGEICPNEYTQMDDVISQLALIRRAINEIELVYKRAKIRNERLSSNVG